MKANKKGPTLADMVLAAIQEGRNIKIVNSIAPDETVITELILKCDCEECKKNNCQITGYFFEDGLNIGLMAENISQEDSFFEQGLHSKMTR